MVQAYDGVVFQYGMPSKAMVRMVTKAIDYEGEVVPTLKTSKIFYNYKFPEVLLNFSKIMMNRDLPNNSTNSSDNSFSYNNSQTNNSNNTNDTNPIRYKIIIAQNYLCLSIVSKCGQDVFNNIPRTGNFQNMNTYYKEITADYAQNFTEFLGLNRTNQSNKDDSNKTSKFGNESNDTMTQENQNSSSNNRGFLSDETNSTLNDNSTSNYLTNNFTNIDGLGFQPFTLYENGNKLNLVVNLDSKDYYFITAIAYLVEQNSTYFYYDPILIKDSQLGNDNLIDIGMIFISKTKKKKYFHLFFIKKSYWSCGFLADYDFVFLQMHEEIYELSKKKKKRKIQKEKQIF